MKQNLLILTLVFLTIITGFSQTPTPTPKTIETGVINGKAVSLPKPVYPTFEKGETPVGEVQVQVTIDEKGNVISAKAISGPMALREVSEKAALASKFSPTKLQSEPVKVTGIIIYKFQPNEPTTKSNEEKLKIMGLGSFLSFARVLPISEWEVLPQQEIENEKFLKEFLLPLTTITPQTSKENQIKILDQVKESLANNLTGDELWQYKFGQEFGELMIDFQNASQNPYHNFDETAIKPKLLNMKNLLTVSPSDIPMDVLSKFTELSNLSEVDSLNSETNKNKFFQLIGEILNLISPSSFN